MEELVFYRKYRPKTFAQFVGQEKIVKTITNAITNNMVSHAYLFSGPRGTGKTTLARLIAKSVNCQNRKEGEYEPCNKCISCLEINEGRAIDLIEIDAASHRGIDDIRELKEGIRFIPTKSKYKVFIIDEAHQLTKEASNALLKILEEPPSHAIFILATTEVHKMIPTIISRCQRFNFKKLTIEEIVGKLKDISQLEKIKIEEPALKLIAQASDGSLRDGESILDQISIFYGREEEITTEKVRELLGDIESEKISQFVELLLERKGKEAVAFLNNVLREGTDLRVFLRSLLNYTRALLILKTTGEKSLISPFTKEEKEKIEYQSKKITMAKLREVIEIFIEAGREIDYSPIPQLPLEIAIAKICLEDK